MSAKQGNHWYHFSNIFGMTQPLLGIVFWYLLVQVFLRSRLNFIWKWSQETVCMTKTCFFSLWNSCDEHRNTFKNVLITPDDEYDHEQKMTKEKMVYVRLLVQYNISVLGWGNMVKQHLNICCFTSWSLPSYWTKSYK